MNTQVRVRTLSSAYFVEEVVFSKSKTMTASSVAIMNSGRKCRVSTGNKVLIVSRTSVFSFIVIS